MLLHKSTAFRVFLLLTCAFGIVVFTSSGKARNPQNKSSRTSSNEATRASYGGEVVRLSAPTKAVPETVSKSNTVTPFESASSANLQLQSNLDWHFGGRPQRGWSLYTPLIGDLIGAATDATPGEFAMQLSAWQKENRLDPSGILDGETWSQMVSRFQSRRGLTKLRSEQSTLVTIPVSDCYDPSRPEELRSVDVETFAAYKRMIAAAAADPSLGLRVDSRGQLAANESLLKIVSAFRSREYQDHLRQKSPNSGRAGLAVNSPHFTGRALDLYVGGEPVSTKDANRALQTQGKVYRWLVKNAARFGFQPYFYEPWHWEYVGVRNTPAN